jgi:hypothetical protein
VNETELKEHFGGGDDDDDDDNNNNNNNTPFDCKTHTYQKNGPYSPENMVEYKDPSYREKYPLCTNLNCVYYADLKSERSQDEYTRLKFGGKFLFCLLTIPIFNIYLINNTFSSKFGYIHY